MLSSSYLKLEDKLVAVTTRQNEIQQLHKDYNWFYSLIGGLVVLIIGIFIGHFLIDGELIIGEYGVNLYTEVVSIIVTVLILDRINDYRAKQQLKKRLVREAGSQSNETAKSAVDWIRHEGWLTTTNGLLKNVELKYANLNRADLSRANLQQSNFHRANLEQVDLHKSRMQESSFIGAILRDADLRNSLLNGTDFHSADLENSDLGDADLQHAVLMSANLHNTNFSRANLQHANLSNAIFSGTDLTHANLAHAIIRSAYLRDVNLRSANLCCAQLVGVLVSNTVLPDGTKWTPNTDMTRFTDPNHPDFWRPDDKLDATE